MGRAYCVSGVNQTVAGATTLIAIRPTSSVGLTIVRMSVSQHANATSAQCVLRWGRKVTAFGTMNAGVTPAKVCESDPASAIVAGTGQLAGTAGINATAEGAGTVTPIVEGESFNALNGFLWVPGRDEAIKLQAGSASVFVLQFQAAPGTLTGWDFSLTFVED